MNIMTFFCESVRAETSQSATLSGILNDIVYLPSTGMLGYICCVTFFDFTHTKKSPEKIFMRINTFGEEQDFLYFRKSANTDDVEIKREMIKQAFSPLLIEKEGDISVFYRFKEDDEFKLSNTIQFRFLANAPAPLLFRPMLDETPKDPIAKKVGAKPPKAKPVSNK